MTSIATAGRKKVGARRSIEMLLALDADDAIKRKQAGSRAQTEVKYAALWQKLYGETPERVEGILLRDVSTQQLEAGIKRLEHRIKIYGSFVRASAST